MSAQSLEFAAFVIVCWLIGARSVSATLRYGQITSGLKDLACGLAIGSVLFVLSIAKWKYYDAAPIWLTIALWINVTGMIVGLFLAGVFRKKFRLELIAAGDRIIRPLFWD
jgi:hypothetical protein